MWSCSVTKSCVDTRDGVRTAVRCRGVRATTSHRGRFGALWRGRTRNDAPGSAHSLIGAVVEFVFEFFFWLTSLV